MEKPWALRVLTCMLNMTPWDPSTHLRLTMHYVDLGLAEVGKSIAIDHY